MEGTVSEARADYKFTGSPVAVVVMAVAVAELGDRPREEQKQGEHDREDQPVVHLLPLSTGRCSPLERPLH